jgi:hypothetical protein
MDMEVQTAYVLQGKSCPGRSSSFHTTAWSTASCIQNNMCDESHHTVLLHQGLPNRGFLHHLNPATSYQIVPSQIRNSVSLHPGSRSLNRIIAQNQLLSYQRAVDFASLASTPFGSHLMTTHPIAGWQPYRDSLTCRHQALAPNLEEHDVGGSEITEASVEGCRSTCHKIVSKSARRRQRRRMLAKQHLQTQLSAAVAHCLSADDELTSTTRLDQDDDHDAELPADIHLVCNIGGRMQDSPRSSSSPACWLTDLSPPRSSGLPCTWQFSPSLTRPVRSIVELTSLGQFHIPCGKLSIRPPACAGLPTTPQESDNDDDDQAQFKCLIELGVLIHSQAGNWLKL